MVESLRNSFPPEFISKQILVSGGAFRKHHEFRNEGEKKRFFFVLNKNPEQDDVILLVTASTKIKELKLKYKDRPDVLVEISPSEYQPLEQPSIVNCEAARAYLKSHIQQFIDNGEIDPLQPLPPKIVEKLHNAIAKCKVIPPEDKRLVLGEEKTTD
jgi:hypothetical protein